MLQQYKVYHQTSELWFLPLIIFMSGKKIDLTFKVVWPVSFIKRMLYSILLLVF